MVALPEMKRQAHETNAEDQADDVGHEVSPLGTTAKERLNEFDRST